MTPHHRPTRVGDICWDQAYVDEMLSPIAQMDQSEIDWFLATHSPITCTDHVGPVKQQVLLDDLLSAFKRETLVVLKGDPGTGKSQLINWLKLGFDVEIASGARLNIGDRRLRSVLIRRRSGSLKDALQQLVDQLPGYERYLDQIAAAIEGISGEAANRRLYTEMHHALLGARASAPRALKELDQVFIDNGAASWLCRPQGAIDLNIKRLTEQSDATTRESLPLFTSEDFNFPSAKVGFDGNLKDRLEDDEGFREGAAARANEHLRQAIAGLTGLRGHTLNEIFRAIREEMQRRGEALALFVEDVSTLSVLDEELVNALQPLNDRSLCPLLSVLGMTEPAYARLPDNLKGRINRVLTLSAESSLLIPGGNDGVDAFVARYLNALRSGPTQVGLLADDARRHGEIQHSACEDCSLKSNCFAAFGSVQMAGSEVGLYPLSPGAAARLLDGLNTDTTLRTPRTLLQYIVRPLLAGMPAEFRGATVGLPLHPRAPLDLNMQQERLLAGWTAEQRGRMSYLLYYWTGFEALADGANALSPMLRWFRHPPFSSAPPPVRSQAPLLPKPQEVPAPERTPETDPRYQNAVARLETWFQQQRPLVRDKEYRDLLAAVVNKSLVLEDVRMPSERIRRLSQINAANIVIEDMTTRPGAASKARFEFARSQDVFDLLRDLLSFEYLGGSSWRFEGGQAACRRYGRWLEVHRDELIRAFNVVKCDREAALRAGIRFLRLAYRFSSRKDLPSDRAAAVEAIASFRPGTIGTLSEAARALAADLPQRLQAVRDVVFDELAVRQGGGGLNFIDPRPLVENLSAGTDDLSLGDFDIAATTADYPDIGRLPQSRWGQLPAVLEEEAAALRKRVESLDNTVRQWGVAADSVPQMLREYLEGARAVVKACEAAHETLGDGALQTEIAHLAPAIVSRHVAVIEQVVSVLDQDWLGVLTLDVGDAEKTFDLVTRSDRAIGRLRDVLAQRLSDVVTGDDVDAERQECLAAIQELITSDTDGTEISGETSS